MVWVIDNTNNKHKEKNKDMGLNKNTNQGGKFLGITSGKISLRVPEGTEGAVERKITKGKNKGKSVFELLYKSVSGYIVGGGLERKEFGSVQIESIAVKIRDKKKEVFTLNIPWGSRFRDGFIKVLPNIDVKKPVEISVSVDKDGNGSLFVNQDGSALKWHYTRANLNGMPEREMKKVKGVEKPDYTLQENFLWEVGEEWFSQFEGDEPPAYQPPANEEEEEREEDSGVEDTLDQDVPF